MYGKYKGWISGHDGWVSLLKKLREHPRGFSFTVKIPEPHLDGELYSGEGYLARTRRREHDEELREYDEYGADWDKYLAGFDEYLRIGAQFHNDVTDPRVDLLDKRRLLIASEKDGHLIHNAAVLWLEQTAEKLVGEPGHVSSEPFDIKDKSSTPNTLSFDERLDYEEVLKSLWAWEMVGGYDPPYDAPRCKALLEYCIGRADLHAIPAFNNPHLPEFRANSHVTLGKVMVRRETHFHKTLEIRAHPGFWGLYLISPMFDLDRGFFDADDDERRWIEFLTARLGMKDDLIRHPTIRGTGRFQIYERVPRLFADAAMTPPGVYLHRSRAHGRDDFLVGVSGRSQKNRLVMAICTKGVGADPGLIPESTAGNLEHTKRLKSGWGDTSNRAFPFGYPSAGEAKNAGSWRNVGFCLMMGTGHDEISSVDFYHFGEMYDEARLHRLSDAAPGFVEPFVAIEISCVPRNKIRMKSVTDGVEDQKCIGYPVEVATVGRVETSLRLYKRSDAQDYDYGHLPLEILEWERCYATVPVPGALGEAIENDIRELERTLIPRAFVPGIARELRAGYYNDHRREIDDAVNHRLDEALRSDEPTIEDKVETAVVKATKFSKYTKYLGQERAANAEGAEGRAKARIRTEIREDQMRFLRDKHTQNWTEEEITRAIERDREAFNHRVEEEARRRAAEHIETVRPAIASLRDRMLLAARIMHGILAAYIIFLDHGWATDTYTGSFSGRNYNSGPRDSNEWGEFSEPSEKPEGGEPSGEGPLRAHVDLGNLSSAVGPGGDLYLSVGLSTKSHLNGANAGDEADAELIRSATLMWSTCALQVCAAKLGGFFTRAKTWLNTIWAKPGPKSNDAVVKEFCQKLAAEAAAEDGLPYGLGDLFKG